MKGKRKIKAQIIENKHAIAHQAKLSCVTGIPA